MTHDTAILSIAFSPDGKQIASGSQDNTVQLWSVEMGVSIGQPIGGHESASFLAQCRWFHTNKIPWFPPAESKPSLQYPHDLFPPSPAISSGWILGPKGELILWVPPAYHMFLQHPDHIVRRSNNPQIDFQHFKCGQEWAQCQELLVK
jgi:WD40 repeat protein